MRPQPTSLLQVRGLAKRYGGQAVFEGVDLQVQRGEFVAIVGDSGVGKSTLLNCLAGLDHWDAGQVLHEGVDLGQLDDTQRALWRRAHVGFVFQAFHVLPHLTLAAQVWGDDALPPLLALHGWLDNAGSYARLAPLLATRFQLIALDLPGHGHADHVSVGAQYHYTDYVRTVLAAADALALDRYSLLGIRWEPALPRWWRRPRRRGSNGCG